MAGEGVLTSPIGDSFKGEWSADKKHGKGVMRYADGDVYEGEYRADVKEGHGTHTHASGDVYEGAYRSHSSLHAFLFTPLILTPLLFTCVEGAYVGGKREGCGTYKRASGMAVVCTFHEDQPTVAFHPSTPPPIHPPPQWPSD